MNIIEAQAGKAKVDSLTIINSIINQYKTKKKTEPLHVALPDVTKAYNKAWLNAILYICT